MQSHWDKLLTIRVVDAGYLLAGLEPKGKWQFAPPLVKNLFNLIHEKTGAVTVKTMPEGRSEITRAEFQELKAKYGVTPATEPKAAPEAANFEQPDYQTLEYQAAYAKAGEDLDAVEKLEIEIKNWQAIPASTVSELERKEQKIAALKVERAALLASVFPGDSQQQAIEPQAAPAVTVGASGDVEQTPDAERRLARLRALGGTAKYVRHEWKFTGMADLVESEKAGDHKRRSEKTIRADLIQAAQAERDEKSAGFGAGLGQR